LFEHADATRLARSADENDHPGSELCSHRMSGKRASFWGAVLPACATQSVGDAKFVREQLRGFARGVAGALPDLLLPERIESFDVGLKAGFAGRREDRGDAVAEAKPDDFADDIRAIMRALKTRIVVELGESGEADFAPMFIKARDRPSAGDGSVDPSVNVRANEAFGGEDVKKTGSLDGQILNTIERIHIRLATRHGGQIPARGRGRAADATTGIQEPMSGENTSDSAHTRKRRTGVQNGEFKRDRLRTDKAQIALGGERVAKGNNGCFESRRSLPSLLVRSRAEIQKRRHLRAGEKLPSKPVLNAAQRDAETGGDSALGEPLCA
jgi:hypothetical protein